MISKSDDISKIAAAMVAASTELKLVGKTGNNTYDKYTYAKLDDYVNLVQPVLAKHGLLPMTSVPEVESLPERTTKNGGKEYPVRVKLRITVIHSSGQWVECEGAGEGQDRADKGLYKAVTGARKYALACLFNLATSDDPESDESVGHAPPPASRPTPKANEQAAKSGFVVKVEKWMGVQPEDRASAWKSLKRAGGFTGAGQLSPGEADLFKKFVEECVAHGDFATAIKGGSK